MDKELEELLAKAKASVKAMSPSEYAAMIQRQRESYVRAEMAFGDDADEAEYRRRMEAGEPLHDTPSGAPSYGEPQSASDPGFGPAHADLAQGAPLTCPKCGPSRTGEICEQEGCPMASGGPVYPDLFERLIARADAEYDGRMNICKRLRAGWSINFLDGRRQTWRPTFESAALQALAKGEER